ncbi:CopG family transcriptional regulator [Methylophilaceae bacterium Uisw_097]
MATTIRFEPEIENRLNHLADATGRTKTFYLKEMVSRTLDELEDYYLAAESKAMMAGEHEEVFDIDQVRAELGLDR